MAIAWNLRRLLDRKAWEIMTPTLSTFTTGNLTITDSSGLDDETIHMAGVSALYSYSHNNDAWIVLPNSGLGGSFGAGTCGTFHRNGPSGTATAGSTTTITTNLTIRSNMTGYTIRINAGPNAGLDRIILSNTQGTNSVITVSVAYPIPITTSSTYTLKTGRFYVLNAGTMGATTFGYYDRALGAWTLNASYANLPTT